MEYTRLNSPSALAEALRDLKKRVAKVENKPMGTISFTDEVTGEETIIGTLPDGSTGVEQFIGDTTPPPVATAPYVSAQPGNFVVTWDGSFVAAAEKPRDFVHVNVIGHKMDVDGTTTLVSLPVGVIRTVTESVLVTLDVASGGESWQFSLESQDYNGNKAVESARSSSAMMVDSISSTDAAWVDMQNDVAAAQATADSAQADATQASLDAQHAIDVANSSSGASGSTYIQSAAPPVSAQTGTTLWIDITDGANTPKRWDGAAWVAITDKAAVDAANAAVAAQNKADQAFNKATDAATDAGNAQTTADGKNRVWYLGSAPAGTAHKVNDLWFDTANDNRLNKWDGTQWAASLLGNSAIYGNIDAAKISVGYLSAAVLRSKSIGVDKLMISSTDNLIMEADFSNNATSWQTSAYKYISANAGRSSMPALRFTGLAGLITSLNINNRIPISPDARFRGSMWLKSSVAAPSGSFKIVGRFYYNATQFNDIVIASNKAVSANTWTNVEGIIPATIPATTIAAEFYISITNASADHIVDVDFISITRASDGKLIVDGAIDGKTITGATIQTAATGPRIVLDQDALNAWNSDGDNYFNVSNETGVNISSKGKAGYDTTRTNYCTNPSMEVDISGWTSAHTLTRDSAFYVGTASLKATHTATADRIVSRKQPLGYPLNAGDYRFSAWVKHNSGVSKTVTAKFYFTDSANAPVAGGTFSGSATTVPPNVWTRVVSGTSTAGTPSNAYNVRMDIVGTAFTSTEALWIDAVYLEGGDFSTFPALNDYFDGDTPATVDKTYVWGSTTGVGLDVSYEHTDRDVRIKSGGNVVLSPMGGSKVAPGIGFIPPVPYLQTAGLFSDGQVVSLIGGADDPMLTRLDVGNQKIESYSYNSTSIVSRDFLHIGSQIGIVDISGSAGVSVNGLSIDSSDWAVVPLSGAWVSYAGGGSYYGGLRARRVGETIQIQGMVKSGAAGTMGTLPMDLAPRYTSLRLVAAGTATTPRQNAYIIIGGGTGIITYDSGPTAPTFVSINEFIPLY